MSDSQHRGSAKRTALIMVGVVVGMFGFGYATVPLYNALCAAIGLNGKVSTKAVNENLVAGVDKSRLVKVQFVTTVNGGHDWEFRAEQVEVEVHPGEFSTVLFHAKNTENHDIVAQAVPNVAPTTAAKHLRKSECFCFNNQPFKAGESKEMPVRFVIDPELPADVDTVTLSYTFFDVTQTAAHEAATTSPNS
jgi:cytochrome c oxidase assembly protein subunit 11